MEKATLAPLVSLPLALALVRAGVSVAMVMGTVALGMAASSVARERAMVGRLALEPVLQLVVRLVPRQKPETACLLA